MEVRFIRRAVKQFKKLPNSEKKKISKKIRILNADPYSGKKLEGELSDSYTLRAWPYRIIYIIDSTGKKIKITNIIHRQGAYK